MKAVNEILYWLAAVARPWNQKRNKAALDVLFPKFNCIPSASECRLSEYEDKIKQLRRWAKTLKPLDRMAYSDWLDFFENDIIFSRKQRRLRKEQQEFTNSGRFPKPR